MSIETTLHVGRSFTGHPIEDSCPCPKAECGLVPIAQASAECDQHGFYTGKTIRQGHPAANCPGVANE